MNSLRKHLMLNAMLSLLCCLAVSAQESSPATQTQSSSSSSAHANADTGSHFALSPYLWFAGAHGTVGAFGRDVSMHASPTDMLSHLNFGLMGAAEFRRKRFLLNGDLLWIRLSESRALPIPSVNTVSADVRVGQLVWTSKIGYRVIGRKKVKADARGFGSGALGRS